MNPLASKLARMPVRRSQIPRDSLCCEGMSRAVEPPPRIIGGMFGLGPLGSPPLQSRQPGLPFLAQSACLLANARSGIRLLDDLLKPRRVWMPSYLCGVMVKAVRSPRQRVKFYAVNPSFQVADDAWLKNVIQGDLVIVIDYFGFPSDPGVLLRARQQGAHVLEDACQAMLSAGAGCEADFALYSPRKWVGVPDGGVLVARNPSAFRGLTLASPPEKWALDSLTAAVRRRNFDLHGSDRRWFTMFRHCDEQGPVGAFAMSELTRHLLRTAFDYAAIARQRRTNYRVLANVLGDRAVFPRLPGDAVPLGFPLRVPQREEVRQRLFEQQIYPPVHWPLAGIVPGQFRESHRLAAELMTLPCDQRCNEGDMEWVAACVRAAIAGRPLPKRAKVAP